MDMNLLKYLAFTKTAECGSFTKAAELLHYTQSGISRMIGDLEKEWNVTLLERSRNGAKLTSDGIRLLPFARRVCEEYSRLQMEVDDLNGLHSGLIRIGSISSTAAHWIPNMIAEFQKSYPNIEYEILLGHYADIESWIKSGRVDCGFTRIPTSERLDCVFLYRDDFFAVIPEDNPYSAEEVFPVSALEEYPFILLEKNNKADVSEFLSQNDLKPNVRFTTVDDYAVMSMIEKGLGISIMPGLILKRIPYQVKVKKLDVPAFRDLGFAVRDLHSASLAVKRFSEYLPFFDR